MFESRLLIVIATFGLLLSGCNPEAEITEDNVSRIISTLSADEMKGRHAFGDEIHDAADFISSEFELIGLSPFPVSQIIVKTFLFFLSNLMRSIFQLMGKN